MQILYYGAQKRHRVALRGPWHSSSSHCLETELLPDTAHLFPSQKKQVRSRDKQRRGVIRAVCQVPSLSERNFNISATILNSTFNLAVARRGWAVALPFLKISAVPTLGRLRFGDVCCARSCMPTQPSRQPRLEEKSPAARSFSCRQGSAALTTPEESGPACAAPDPNTRRLFAGRGQLGLLLCWSYRPFARTHFALASGCPPVPSSLAF